MSNTDALRGVVEFRANARRRVRIGEENRAERDVARAACDQLERVLSRRHTAHADDRQTGCCVTRVHRCESDRLQRRTGKTARRAREHRLQRARIERSSTQRVDQREAVGARIGDRRRDRGDVRDVRRKAWRRAGLRSPRGTRRRSRPRRLRPRRRSGTRGSTRSRRCRRALRMCLRSRPRRNPPTEIQSGTPSSRKRGRWSSRKRSRPGFASPIAFNIPCAGLRDPHGRVAFARQRRDRLRDEAVELRARRQERRARRDNRTR